MVAVDTNVIVRLLVADDKRQTARARALFASNKIWIGKTVLLESFWVLREVYELPASAIIDQLEKLLGLPNISADGEAGVQQSLQLARAGMDFADALHVIDANPRAFASFDRKLVSRSRRAGLKLAEIPD
jgi:predicted nucleic-acid-binding protein